VLDAWRESVEISRAEVFGDLEERAMKLAVSAGRVRERHYAGARVIEVAPIRDVAANVNVTDVQGGRTATVAHTRSCELAEPAEMSHVRTKTVKIETAGEIKKIKSEKKKKIKASETEAKTRTRERKAKSEKKVRERSTPAESSEEEDEASPKRTSQGKRVKSKNKHKSSDTEGDIKKPKKVAKDKIRKDKDKIKKWRKLEYATEDSSEDERPKKQGRTRMRQKGKTCQI